MHNLGCMHLLDTKSERFYVFMIILGGLDWTGLLFICWILDWTKRTTAYCRHFLVNRYLFQARG